MTKDSELYKASKQFVLDRFSDCYNKTENVLVLSVSRKGPKFLECLFGRKNYDLYNTITEVALPFCMKRIAAKPSHPQIKIFDDAVYYGTTVEGILHELEAFEKVYDTQSPKELITAIRAKESRANFKEVLRDVSIHSYNDDNDRPLRTGYGHYFIRQLADDLCQMNNTMEIEFPIVEFESDSDIDSDALFEAFRIIYGKERTYIVRSGKQTSLSIIFDEKEGQSFSKIRVYVMGRVLRIVVMAPWILPDNITILIEIFNNTCFFPVWIDLLDAFWNPVIGSKTIDADSYMRVERCIMKSLVIMANYLLSYGHLVEERQHILSVFEAYGKPISYEGVKTIDLFYLLGEKNYCDKVRELFNDLWNENGTCFYDVTSVPNMKPTGQVMPYQVFEEKDFPDAEESEKFQRQNHAMLGKCQTHSEALSALFYNQTSLIEKWSRRSDKYDSGRLRFGYTFASLQKEVALGKSKEYHERLKIGIQHWVDNRVDQACIVPQYVRDYQTGLWCRVFRPGENEDALLSHLARYVLAIFYSIDQVQGLGWVYKEVFQELLCLSAFYADKEMLRDSFEFELVADLESRCLKFRYDANSDERDVLDYLTDMNVFTEKNGMMIVSKDLADEDMKKATTLDEELENAMKTMAQTIMRQIAQMKYQKYPFFVTNFYFYQPNELQELRNANEIAMDDLRQSVASIERGEDKVAVSKELFASYVKSKRYIVATNIIGDENVLEAKFTDIADRESYIREMIVMWKIKFAFELLIVTQLQADTSLLKREMQESTHTVVYGCPLEWDDEVNTYFTDLLAETDNIVEIGERSLSFIKNRIEEISYINIRQNEYAV